MRKMFPWLLRDGLKDVAPRAKTSTQSVLALSPNFYLLRIKELQADFVSDQPTGTVGLILTSEVGKHFPKYGNGQDNPWLIWEITFR